MGKKIGSDVERRERRREYNRLASAKCRERARLEQAQRSIELVSLRHRVADLEAENAELRDQIATLMIALAAVKDPGATWAQDHHGGASG